MSDILNKNKDRLLKIGTPALLISVSIFLYYLAKWPLIPREGDPFGCWYDYAANLQQFGLAKALIAADASGRYPGYPMWILAVQSLFQTDYLNSLRVLRVFFLIGSYLAVFWFLMSQKIERLTSVLLASVLILVPSFWQNITMNTQDSFKIMFFILTLVFFLRDFQKKGHLGPQNKLWFTGFVFCSVVLSMCRGPEILPLYTFICCLFFLDPELTMRKKIRGAFVYMLPSLIAVAALHIYARPYVGHWSVSAIGASTPDIWLKLAIKHAASENRGMLVSFAKVVWYGFIVFLNKTGYFVEDYIFSVSSFRMLDVYKLNTDLQMQSPLRFFLYLPAACLLIFSLLRFSLRVRRPNTPKVVVALFWSALVSAGFYTFGLNHYEPRYWLCVFGCAFLGFGIYFSRLWPKKVIAALVVGLVCLTWISVDLLAQIRTAYAGTQSESARWGNEVKRLCEIKDVERIVIPYEMYLWSSFRFFAKDACPRMKIWRLGPESLPAEPIDLSASIVLDKAFFANKPNL